MKSMAGETRTPERLREHYEIERELSDRLRESSEAERTSLYTEVYEELFARVPDHPQLTGSVDEAGRRADVNKQLHLLSPFAKSTSSFLEVGAGDCALSVAMAASTNGEVHAIDVSKTITEITELPPTVQVHVTDGREIPVAEDTINVAYSNQLLEHLHPDDALEQTANIARSLRSDGVYVCITPNRLSGPHDISMFFDEAATGFHLREYTTGELAELFARAGFRRTASIVPIAGRVLVFPAWILTALERVLQILPRGLGYRIARETPLGRLFGRVAAYR